MVAFYKQNLVTSRGLREGKAPKVPKEGKVPKFSFNTSEW